jgi:hypothetical protein
MQATATVDAAPQFELKLKLPAPVVTEAEVDALCAHLDGRGWQTAKQLEQALGLDDRKLRAIAEHSDGRVLSGPGSPGYRLFTREALADADRCAALHESQAKRQLQRAAAIRRRFHRYARP